jgi:hypothetical protein
VGLEPVPLSLVRINEELLERKSKGNMQICNFGDAKGSDDGL